MMTQIKTYVFGCLTVLTLILIWQNTQVVAIKFLFWEWGMSRAILIPSVFLMGVIVGYLAKSRTQKKAEKPPPS